jgi:PAS domain S-box-containing protein|tara:strand:+ start:11050 stop:11571 length:522 start_codon:yes stop_codon:yes gene_type:complete
VKYQGKERFFDRNDLIVSKTDLKGRLMYANDIFLNIAGYTETEIIGQPHKIIRHSNMPRAVFKLLWQTIAAGAEIFAYVVNRAKTGDYYWVIAHITPSLSNGKIIGYHSTRRVPNPQTIKQVIEPLYDSLNLIETTASSQREGLEQSFRALLDVPAAKNQSYDEFISRLVRKD